MIIYPGRRITYRDEGSNLLSVLDKLHTDTFANSRVRLLGFNADLFEHNALCVGRASSGRCFIYVSESTLFVSFIRLEK